MNKTIPTLVLIHIKNGLLFGGAEWTMMETPQKVFFRDKN